MEAILTVQGPAERCRMDVSYTVGTNGDGEVHSKFDKCLLDGSKEEGALALSVNS